MRLLRPSKAPSLAPSPIIPAKGHLDTVLNALRLYFTQIDNSLGAVVGRLGGRHLQFPYGAFQSNTTQTQTVVNTPKLVTLDAVDYASDVYYTAGNGIHVGHSGIYNVQFSIQLTNANTQAGDAAIWLRVDGVDVPWSSSVVTVPSTHGGVPGYYVISANFYLELLAGQYLEFWWAASDIQVELNALPPITTPFVNPGSPAVVVTVSFVSNLPE